MSLFDISNLLILLLILFTGLIVIIVLVLGNPLNRIGTLFPKAINLKINRGR